MGYALIEFFFIESAKPKINVKNILVINKLGRSLILFILNPFSFHCKRSAAYAGARALYLG